MNPDQRCQVVDHERALDVQIANFAGVDEEAAGATASRSTFLPVRTACWSPIHPAELVRSALGIPMFLMFFRQPHWRKAFRYQRPLKNPPRQYCFTRGFLLPPVVETAKNTPCNWTQSNCLHLLN